MYIQQCWPIRYITCIFLILLNCNSILLGNKKTTHLKNLPGRTELEFLIMENAAHSLQHLFS